jgi:hypothetical protein
MWQVGQMLFTIRANYEVPRAVEFYIYLRSVPPPTGAVFEEQMQIQEVSFKYTDNGKYKTKLKGLRAAACGGPVQCPVQCVLSVAGDESVELTGNESETAIPFHGCSV